LDFCDMMNKCELYVTNYIILFINSMKNKIRCGIGSGSGRWRDPIPTRPDEFSPNPNPTRLTRPVLEPLSETSKNALKSFVLVKRSLICNEKSVVFGIPSWSLFEFRTGGSTFCSHDQNIPALSHSTEVYFTPQTTPKSLNLSSKIHQILTSLFCPRTHLFTL